MGCKIKVSPNSIRCLECCINNLKQDLKTKMTTSSPCGECPQEEIDQLINTIAELNRIRESFTPGGNEYIKKETKCPC